MRIELRAISAVLALAGLLGVSPARAADEGAASFEQTPPRLSLVDGEVSFWRPGAPDWVIARLNTPLAAGDQLGLGERSSLELQVAPAVYLRAGERSQLGLTSLEPDYLQFRVSAGTASLDVRSLRPGQTFELDTPNAAFIVEHTGYYRLYVGDDTTTFISRRGGRATVTPANGASAAVEPSEEVVVSGTDSPTLETYAAPELDDWDRWNYARTDDQLDAVSSRYVASGVYGIDDLDQYGTWRVVSPYGAVWVPNVVVGWAPYSTGVWVYDPFFGWTWVDDAPWGWAPFHYGRWVFVSGFWGWCPGRVVARPVYAPALVAFYGSVGVTLRPGHAPFGWVALGWGEPVIPWWGPVGWRGTVRWVGWGGPRRVNGAAVTARAAVQVKDIHWSNASIHGAIVAVDRDAFGRRPVPGARVEKLDVARLAPVRSGDLGVRPAPASLVGEARAAPSPPHREMKRRVVAVREPERPSVPEFARGRRSREPVAPPAPRVVTPRAPERSAGVPLRPPFGRNGEIERAAPPLAPRFEPSRGARGSRGAPPATGIAPQPQGPPPRTGESPREAVGPERDAGPRGAPTRQGGRELPGEPASRVFPRRGDDFFGPRGERPGGPGPGAGGPGGGEDRGAGGAGRGHGGRRTRDQGR